MWFSKKPAGSQLHFTSTAGALRCTLADGSTPAETWLVSPPMELKSDDQRRCGVLLQWLGDGLARLDGGTVHVPLDALYQADPQDLRALDLAEVCPYPIALRALGALHEPGFAFEMRFLGRDGRPLVGLEREGCFLLDDEQRFFLDRVCFELCELLDAFANRPPEDRTHERQLLAYSRIKDLAEQAGARLDAYFERETARVPQGLSIDLVDHGEVLEVRPVVDGVSPESLAHTLDQHRQVPGICTVLGEEGDRDRLVLDPGVRMGFEQVKRVRRLSGRAREDFLACPQDFLDAQCIDLSEFGERVKGIGAYAVRYYPMLQKGAGSWVPERIGLRISSDDPARPDEEVTFESLEEFAPLEQAYEQAKAEQRSVIPWGEWQLPIDGETERTLEAIHEALEIRAKAESTADDTDGTEEAGSPPPVEEAVPENAYLLIHDNVDDLGIDTERRGVILQPRLEMPRSLKPSVKLLPHQVEGLAWLQELHRRNLRGALVADDMGLGKTVQILAFMAWRAEAGDTKPMLVVAPVALLENWLAEYRKFLEPILGEPLALHGDGLAKFRIPNAGSGREYQGGGRKLLDREAIARHGLVLTTYEAVRDYQFSLAGIPWSVLVTDEAQKIKTPEALMTRAAKALSADFRIAATGTPVENSLVDLWCLMDFARPGLLGSLKAFREEHAPREEARVAEGATQLRSHIETALLRRLKGDILKDLPARTEYELPIPMSSSQIRRYTELVEAYRASARGRGQILGLMHQLRDVSVHPDMLGEAEPSLDLATLRQTSPKLAWVMDRLGEVAKLGEKCLLFTEDRRLQRALAQLIRARFGFMPAIVNGEVAGASSRGPTRKGLLDRFQSVSGFNTIVLSPLAVGYGLTVTEANHVIHVTRLWNPAKEDQATDRAHRIGQVRPVHVYYPTSVHPQGLFPTFDETLAKLLARKRGLARNFLYPTDRMGVEIAELESELLGPVEGRPARSGA